MIFWSTPEKTEETERLGVCAMGALWSIYELVLSYMTLFVYVSLGMNVSTKRKDDKTVMGYKKHKHQEWNITRSPEFGSEMSLRTENNRTEQENNKMAFPNEEGQDE